MYIRKNKIETYDDYSPVEIKSFVGDFFDVMKTVIRPLYKINEEDKDLMA